MGEKRFLIAALILFSLISFSALYFTKVKDLRLIFSDIFVKRYDAKIVLDDVIKLYEFYTFQVEADRRYRMLYRFWRAPLLVNGTLNKPFIKFQNFYTENFDWYVKDYEGNVFGNFSEKAAYLLAKHLAYRNELGVVNPYYFDNGIYEFGAEYELYPPAVFVDEELTYVPLILADRHIPYKEVEIEIEDKKRRLYKVYPFLAGAEISRKADRLIIKGYSPRHAPISVYLLLNPEGLKVFKYSAPYLQEKIWSLENTKRILGILQNLLMGLVVLYPLLFYLFYKFLGSERKFLVPKYLNYIPNRRRKPWEVNVIFSGDALRGDKNAFFSTLLDLMRRGYLKIEGKTIKLANRVQKSDLDIYERQVVKFIMEYGNLTKEGFYELDFDELQSKVNSWARNQYDYGLKRLKNALDTLTNFKNPYTKRLLDLRGFYIFLTMTLLFLLIFIVSFFARQFFIKSGSDFYPFLIYSGALALNGILGFLLFPSQFFGRWKGSYYKEKLQWEAFKNFLKDMAMLEKYSPGDISIWKEWLIYATALGVADMVEKALQTLNVEIPEVEEIKRVRVSFSSLNTDVSFALSSLSSSSSSSLGGGGGGGFGGGGAGAR